MALTYISIPTDQYTYADINNINADSINPRPKFIDNSSWTLTKNVEFVGFGYQYTGGTTPPSQTPLYAIYLISSSVSNISSCWLQNGGPSGTDNTHVSSPSSYSNFTYVWHHLNSGNTTPMQLYVGGSTQEISTYEFVYDTEYGEEGNNVWTRSGKDMQYGFTYHIRVNADNQWIPETIPVQANYVYDITATVQSEKNWDGIVITTGTHSAPTGNFSNTSGIGGWSDVVLALTSSTSGTSTTSSTTYTATSNGNLYLYFRTDTGTLNPNPEIGQVEISGHPNSGITITLNDNGGSGGSGTKTVASGTVSGNIGSVNVPTRGSNPAFTFVGYYDTVAYSGGRYFIDSSGNGTNGYTISSAITLYARWSNTISYEPASSLSLTYSTSQQSRTIASTATCASGGTVTYSISSVRKNGTIITNPGFSITLASNGYTTNLIVPASLAVGTYTITIGLTSPNSGSASSSTYAAGSLSKTITVTISAQSNITITFEKNGGTGGSDSVSMAPSCPASQYPTITLPTRGTFRFDGYYSAISGGTQYFDENGAGVNTGPATPTSMFAHWYNTVSYSPSNVSTQTSSSSQNLTVSSTGWSCASGETLNSYEIDNIYKNGTSVSATGWSISSNGKTITIPANIATGTYTVRVALQSKSLTTGSSTYYGDDFDTSFTVTISAQSNITITLDRNGGTTGDTSFSVAPGASVSNYPSITMPTRGTFTFDGYYTSRTGGTKKINASGTPQAAAPTSAETWFAHWYNTVSYSPTGGSATYSANSQNVTVSSTAGSCASGGTVTYEIDVVFLGANSISLTNWSISSDGKTVTIPAALAAGTYAVRVFAQSPGTTSGTSTYIGDDLYVNFNIVVSEATPQNNAWSYSTSNLIGGTVKRVYTNTQSSPGNIDSLTSGPSDTTQGTTIIELYHDPGTSSNSGVGVGLVGPTVTTSGLGSGVISGRTCFFDGVGVYDFMAQSVNVEPYVGQSTAVRKVYSVHNYDVSTSNGVKAVYLGTKSGSTNSVGYYGYSTPALFNKWASHVSGDSRRKYYAITVNTSYTYDYVEISVQSGKSYTFNMYADSEAKHDGILLTNAIISNPTSAIGYTNLDTYKSNNSSTCLEVCHGNKVNKSYSYTPSSNQTLYLYYYTDVGTIKMGGANASACIGACEVIERVSMTITFNKVGGSNGTSTTTIYSQTPAADYPSITVPTRSGYTFLGYWDSSAANSGTQYVTSTGAGARVWDKTSNTTLYARWENNVSYTTTNKSVYCTDAAVVATSTTASRTVAISSAGCSATAGTCSAVVQVCPAGQTWTVTSNGKTLTVPSGVSAGTYNITIRCTSSAGGTAGSNYYYAQTKDYTVTITVVATAISSYANPTVTCSGKSNMAAAGETVTLSPSFSQTATWNNNATSTITTGGSYTYAVRTTSTGFSLINTNQVKVTNNTSTSTRGTFKVRVTCSINGTSGYVDASFTQEAGSQVYEIPLISSFTYALYPASGATNSPVIEFTQHWTWNGVNDGTGGDVNSGGTKSFTASSLPTGCSKNSTTTFQLDGEIKWANRGTDTGAARNANNKINVTVTVNGQTSSPFSCSYCEQEANYLTWGNVSLTVSSPATPYAMNKAGETVAISASATQSATYTSGSTDSYTPVLSYAVKTSKNGYSLSSNSVTVTNNNSSTARNGFVVTVTATGITGTNSTYETGFNKTATSDRTFNQAAGAKVYANPTVTGYSYANFSAAGESSKYPTVTYTQDWTWNGVSGSGDTDSYTYDSSHTSPGGTFAFTVTGALTSGFSKGTSFATSGRITAASRGTTIGNARNCTSKLSVVVTVNSKASASFTCSGCIQNGNYVTVVAPRASSGTTHIAYADIGPGATSAPVTTNGGATYTFTSGDTSTSVPGSSYGSVTYSRTYTLGSVQNGFTAVNSSGTLTVTSKGTTVGGPWTSGNVTSVLTVTWTHSSTYSAGGTKSGTMTSTVTCTQTANALTNLSISVGTNPINYGGTSTCTVTATYTSGATKNVDCDTNTTYSFDPTGIVTVTKS